MAYFGVNLKRYGGYDRKEELANAELSPDREPREKVTEDD